MVQIDKQIMNIKELCSYLNISQSMIRKLIYENRIPYFRIGYKYCFDKRIINQWIIDNHRNFDINHLL